MEPETPSSKATTMPGGTNSLFAAELSLLFEESRDHILSETQRLVDSKIYASVIIRGDVSQKMFDVWARNISNVDGGKVIEITVDLSNKTTHIVLSPTSTHASVLEWMNQGDIPRSLAIVSYQWIVDSLKRKRLLDPADYPVAFGALKPLPVIGKVEAENEQDKPATKPTAAMTTVLPMKPSERLSTWADKKKNKFACSISGTLPPANLNLNKHITDKLDALRTIYERSGDQYRAVSYKRCVSALQQMTVAITDIEQLRGKKFFGDSILEKIDEILETDGLKKLQHLQSNVKENAIVELCGVWGIGPETARNLVKQGFASIQSLRDAGRHLLNSNQLVGLDHFEEFKVRIPREEVQAIEDTVRRAAEA